MANLRMELDPVKLFPPQPLFAHPLTIAYAGLVLAVVPMRQNSADQFGTAQSIALASAHHAACKNRPACIRIYAVIVAS